MFSKFFSSDTILTNCQIELVNKLKSFIKSDCQSFIISGAAGTGKTFIIRGLTSYLDSIGLKYHLCAPTGRAAKVLTEKVGKDAYTIHKTIYSQNKAIEYDNFIDGINMPVIYFTLRVCDDDETTIYIVDEASMVSDSDNNQEYLRFGSGNLLNDLIEYVNIGFEGNHRKIVFIGDKYQLPPVNSINSPALDIGYLEACFSLKVEAFELSEIVRQKRQSGILENANDIRNSLVSNRFNILHIKPSSDVIVETDFCNYIEQSYLDIIASVDTVMITYTNERALAHNKAIKQKINIEDKLCINDRIVVVNNCKIKGVNLLNGDFCTVVKLIGSIETKNIHLHDKNKPEIEKLVTLYFQDAVIIKDTDKEDPIEIKLLLNVLYNNLKQLSPDEARALYIQFKINNNQINPSDPKFLTILGSDKYYNALQIKYGYSVTCHKAQGGEWDKVFVDFSSYCFSSISNQFYYKWVYTAITRSKRTLICFAPPTIDFINIKSELAPSHDAVNHSSGIEIELATIFNETEDFEQVVEYLLSTRGFVLLNCKNIQYGFEFVVKGKTNMTSLKYNVYYNKMNFITRIVPQTNVTENDDITLCLEVLLGFSIDKIQNQIESTHSFPNDTSKSIFGKYSIILNNHNIKIKALQHHQWNEKYFLLQNNYLMILDIIYDKKGFVSNVIIEPNYVTEDLVYSIELFKQGK